MVNLSTEFVTRVMKILINEFTHLFNAIIESGIYPDEWKLAIVTTVPKIPHPQSCSDLHPISILPLPSRIFETLVADQMTKHVE